MQYIAHLEPERMKWSPVFIGWAAATLLFTAPVLYQALHPERAFPWRLALAQRTIYCVTWLLLVPVLVWLCLRFRIERRRWSGALSVNILVSLLFSLAHLSFCALLLPIAGWKSGKSFSEALALLINGSYLQLDLFFYWATLALIYGFDYRNKYLERNLRASQLEARLAQAQLQVLRLQLHPHFLFNTLHTVSTFMHKDVEAADNMITHLSDLLRITLKSDGAQEVPLKQELDLLDRYLQIEQFRFQDRLRVRMNIDPGTPDALVPNLVLQPLTENAIKHGLAQRIEGGLIEISSVREHDTLRIRIRDDGPGLSRTEESGLIEGIGLANTRARLRQLYGEAHRFELSNSAEGGLEVTLVIPFRESEAVSDD